MSRLHPNFKAKFPRSTNLGLTPVSTGSNDHPGFDSDAVQGALGGARYNNLLTQIKGNSALFSCGHRTKNGVEVPCVYAQDLESFLANGG